MSDSDKQIVYCANCGRHFWIERKDHDIVFNCPFCFEHDFYKPSVNDPDRIEVTEVRGLEDESLFDKLKDWLEDLLG